MIVERFITPNKYSRPCRTLNKVLGVVVHYVGVPFQKPENTVRYFDGLKFGKNGTYASAHYVIGIDGNGINCIPETEVAYHCGAKVYREGITQKLGNYPNYTTIGIEMCHTKEGFSEETLTTASKLVARILAEHGLTYADVYRHYDITGKICPKFFVDNPRLWDDFRNRVQVCMNAYD